MASMLVITTIAALIVVASLSASALGPLVTQPPEAKPSCGVPAVNEPVRRPDTALGYILLQTKTKASAVIMLGNIGMQDQNRSVADEKAPEPQGLLDDASLLSVRVGQRSGAVKLEAQQNAGVPLGMPGSAASLLTVLRQGVKYPIYTLHREDSNFWTKLVILLLMCGLCFVCCTGATASQMRVRPSRHETLTAAGFTQGVLVQATRTFISDGEIGEEINPGQQAKITKIDADGDVLVQFDKVKIQQWVRYQKALDVLRPLGDSYSPPRAHVDNMKADERTDRQAFLGSGMDSASRR